MMEDRSVSISFMSSLLFHVILGTSYLYLKHMQDTNMLLLENIEFIEIHPDIKPAQDICVPAQSPPKSVIDFIKMALPTFKKPELQDIAEPEMEEKIKTEQVQKIDMNKALDKPLDTKISLKEKKLSEIRQLSDIVAEKSPDSRQVSAMLTPDEPAIDIAEVGRTAVKDDSIMSSISLSKKAAPVQLKDMSEVDTPSKTGTSQMQNFRLKETPVNINKSKPVSGSLPVGYSKGIVLAKARDQENKLPQEINIPQTVSKKSDAIDSSKVKEAKPDKKSVELTGPVVGRSIIKSYLPVYPNWAKAKNIEADVTIRFFVSQSGIVRDKTYIERTSGYSELDKLAVEALKKWVFEPVKGEAGDQWGIITFRYMLQ